jgi:hypothetical protein
MTMDIITASDSPMVHAGFPAELPATEVSPSNIPIKPLDLIESPKVRTKLRLYAILLALYVTYPV